MFDISGIKHFIEIYPPALPGEIDEAEKSLHLVIPNIYKRFLLATNGALGNLASLYGAGQLVEKNKTYQVQEYAPGYVSIGNDHGGCQFLMRAQKEETEFRLVGDGSGVVTENDCKDDFVSWLTSDSGDPWRNKPGDISGLKPVELVLVKLPQDGKKGLLRLKKALRLQISIGQLIHMAGRLPCTLCTGITLANAKAKIKNAKEQDIFEIRPL